MSIIAGLAVVVAVVALGMGGDDSGDDSNGGGEASSGDRGDGNSDESDAAAPAPPDLAVADLQPTLLTLTDVGPGFVASVADGAGDDSLTPEQIDASPECLEVFNRLFSSDGGDGIQARFASTSSGSEVAHEIDPIQEGDFGIADYGEALDRCPTMSFDTGQAQGDVRVEAEQLDGPGEGALGIAFEVEGFAGGRQASVDSYAVMWSRDGLSSSVVMSSFDPVTFEAREVDRDIVRQLAETADQKLDGWLAG